MEIISEGTMFAKPHCIIPINISEKRPDNINII